LKLFYVALSFVISLFRYLALQNGSRLKFKFQVQITTTVNELTLSAYTKYLIWYTLSDDGVSRLRLVVIARPANEKTVMVRYMQTKLSC